MESEIERWQEELRSLDLRLCATPSCAETWTSKAVVLNRLGRHREAMAAVERALKSFPAPASAWRVKGVLLRDIGLTDAALACFDHGLQCDPRDWMLWKEKAAVLAGEGRFDIAKFAFEQCLSSLGPHDEERASIRISLGLCWFSEGRRLLKARLPSALLSAIKCFEEAIEHWKAPAQSHEWALAQSFLGDSLYVMPARDKFTNIQRAIEAYRAALRFIFETTDSQRWAEIQANLGSALVALPGRIHQANLDAAVSHYEAALRVFTEDSAPAQWAAVHDAMARAYMKMRAASRDANVRRAIAHCNVALRVRTEEEFPEDWARTHTSKGLAYSELRSGDRTSNLKQAIDCYEAALKVLTPMRNAEEWATTQTNLASAWAELPTGDREVSLQMAITHHEKALTVWTEADNPREWAMTQSNLAMVWAALAGLGANENLQLAINGYQAALRVFSEKEWPDEWALTINNLGNAWARLRTGDLSANMERAIYCHRLALRVRTEQRTPVEWARSCRNLGGMLTNSDGPGREANVRSAIGYLDSACRVFTEQSHPWDWAGVQVSLGRAWIAMSANRPENMGRAIDCYKQAVRVFTSEAYPFDCQNVHDALEQIYFEQQRWAEALDHGKQAFDVTEQIRRESILDGSGGKALSDSTEILERAIISAVRAGRTWEALELSQRGKTRTWNDYLSRMDLRPRGVSVSQWNAYLSLSATLTKARRNLEMTHVETRDVAGSRDFYQRSLDEVMRLRQDLRQLEVQFAETDPSYIPFSQPLTAAAMAKIASQSAAVLVDLRVCNEAGYAFLIGPTGDGVIALELPRLARSAMRSILADWIAICKALRQSAGADRLDQLCHELYDIVIGPVVSACRQRWPMVNRLVLSPSQILSLLPLHAAWANDAGARHFVCDDFEIIYSPSFNLMKLSADRARRQNVPNRLFAVQDPDRTLRFSEWEVDGCARHFARDCRFIKKGEEATVDAVKHFAGEATELLFSCHGRFEAEKPRDSALILYGTERLRIAEILALRLSEVDLVVASACETGLSDIRDVADEYVGLPGAFVAAGVRTVVSSLWAVSDLATALLIERFHENLYRHGMTASEALRSAQRWLRDVELQEILGRLKEKQDALTAMNWNGIEDDLDALTNRISVADVGMARTTVRKLGLRPFSNPAFWAAFQIVGAGW